MAELLGDFEIKLKNKKTPCKQTWDQMIFMHEAQNMPYETAKNDMAYLGPNMPYQDALYSMTLHYQSKAHFLQAALDLGNTMSEYIKMRGVSWIHITSALYNSILPKLIISLLFQLFMAP